MQGTSGSFLTAEKKLTALENDLESQKQCIGKSCQLCILLLDILMKPEEAEILTTLKKQGKSKRNHFNGGRCTADDEDLEDTLFDLTRYAGSKPSSTVSF